jgi:replication factor C large subunit
MTAGVSQARDGEKSGWTRYSPPSWKRTGKTKVEICQKIAAKSGTSISTAMHDILPFLKTMTHHCKNKELTIEMVSNYDLDESEVSEITGSGKTTNKVENIVEEGQARQRQMKEESDASWGTTNENASDSTETQSTNTSTETEDATTTTESDSDDGDNTDEDESDDGEQAGLDDFM